MRTATPLPRRHLLATGALGVSTLVLPAASAAASTDGVQSLACDVPTLTAIPFLAQGASTTVGDVTITATVNTAVDPADWSHAPDGYLHAGGTPAPGAVIVYPAGQDTTLTFSPGLTSIELRTEFHDDGGGLGVQEVYTLTGRTAAGTELFSETITNLDTTVTLPATGEFAPGLAELEIAYSAIGTPRGQYASILYLRMLAC